MQKNSLRVWILLTAISLLLVIAGSGFILRRTLNNPIKGLSIRGDTIFYTAMIEGGWHTVDAPYRYRVLVPFLASLLPFSPAGSLRVITYISLFFAYIFMLLTCQKAGLSLPAGVVGLLAVWAAPWHLNNYHNPYLTDAFGLLTLSVMVYALLSDSFYLYLAAALAGILARETAVFLIPAWVACERQPGNRFRRGSLLVLLSLLTLVLPRLLLGPPPDDSLAAAFSAIGLTQLSQPLIFTKAVLDTWGIVWVFALLGICFLPGDTQRHVGVALALLLAGALITSLIATDTGRMFSILAPVFVIGCAQFFTHLAGRSRILAAVFIVLNLVRGMFTWPSIIFPYGSPAFSAVRQPLLYIEAVFCLLAALAFVPDLFARMWNPRFFKQI